MMLNEYLRKDIEFEHIGIAVNDIKECLNLFSDLFNVEEVSEIYEDDLQNINILFMNLPGTKIELISPLNRTKKSPVDSLLKKNISYYHLCFRTKCLEETILQLVKRGAIEVVKPIPAVAFGNSKIAFLFIKHLGMIELVEKKNENSIIE
ncbi:MAG: VOC family protein [Candidatus Brocadiaceae bacterium]|nr:VOC family protein [Candidatus Brocadiaceae bacterium]